MNKPTREQVGYLVCVKVALLYMMRPNCHTLAQKSSGYGKRWESHIKFINRIFENLKNAGIDEEGKFYKIVCARVILACSAKLQRRETLLSPVLDAIDYLLGDNK